MTTPYRNRKVEKAVLECYKLLPGSMLRFPIDVVGIIRCIPGCSIHSYQTFAQKNNIPVRDVSQYCGSYDGCVHSYRSKRMIMYNNSGRITLQRKLFTIAHELGHIMLGHQDPENAGAEREANYFAATLLCPMPIVSAMPSKSPDLLKIAFNLSQEAAEIAWKNFASYDKTYYIAWHNDIIKLFPLHAVPSTFHTYPLR